MYTEDQYKAHYFPNYFNPEVGVLNHDAMVFYEKQTSYGLYQCKPLDNFATHCDYVADDTLQPIINTYAFFQWIGNFNPPTQPDRFPQAFLCESVKVSYMDTPYRSDKLDDTPLFITMIVTMFRNWNKGVNRHWFGGLTGGSTIIYPQCEFLHGEFSQGGGSYGEYRNTFESRHSFFVEPYKNGVEIKFPSDFLSLWRPYPSPWKRNSVFPEPIATGLEIRIERLGQGVGEPWDSAQGIDPVITVEISGKKGYYEPTDGIYRRADK